MVMIRCHALLSMLFLSGCATLPPVLETPILLVGTVKSHRWTGWAIDYCGHGQPVKESDRIATAECLPHGGELYAAKLTSVRQPGAGRLSGSIQFAFLGHGIHKGYSKTHYLVLQPSTADFEKATGITLVAATRDNYDAQRNCLTENGFGHMDWRSCSDVDFHERNRGVCLPVPDYLAHYSAHLSR